MNDKSSGKVIANLADGDLSRPVISAALQCRGSKQANLFALARQQRSVAFPSEEVEVRSVIEVSNVCRQGCRYCNMGLKSKQEKYTISYEELLRLAEFVYEKKTVVCCCSNLGRIVPRTSLII